MSLAEIWSASGGRAKHALRDGEAIADAPIWVKVKSRVARRDAAKSGFKHQEGVMKSALASNTALPASAPRARTGAATGRAAPVAPRGIGRDRRRAQARARERGRNDRFRFERHGAAGRGSGGRRLPAGDSRQREPALFIQCLTFTGDAMRYQLDPIHCRPWLLNGLSVKLIESHYENNYGGALRRLNAITEKLESLDFENTPGYVINGLKREELIALNSTLLHELYFASLGGAS